MDLAFKARTYLDSRRGERVTLDELAQAIGASPFHLQRRFKEAFGRDPKPSAKDGYRAMQGALKAIADAGAAGNDRTRVIDAYFK